MKQTNKLLAVAVLAFACGCQTLQNPENAGRIAERVVYRGTLIELLYRPQDRPELNKSRIALRVTLNATGTNGMNAGDLAMVLTNLPINKLGTNGALVWGPLAFELVDELGQIVLHSKWGTNTDAAIRPVAEGVYRGMDRALGP
jgi:hypothetical protein